MRGSRPFLESRSEQKRHEWSVRIAGFLEFMLSRASKRGTLSILLGWVGNGSNLGSYSYRLPIGRQRVLEPALPH